MTSPGFSATWEEAVRDLRNRSECRQLVRDAYYDDPLLDAAERYRQSDEWIEIRKLLPSPPARILDAGAGRGIVSYALARDGYVVTALEPDPSDLVGAGAIRSLAEQSGLSIEVLDGRAEQIDSMKGTFDAVCARAVLHHTADLVVACSEFFRVLRPGGRLIAFREHVISKETDLSAFLETHPLHHLYGGENAFLLATYLGALEKSGFVVERVIGPWDSAINFAPHTYETLQHELARRAARLFRFPGGLLKRLIAARSVWPVVLMLLRRFDSRPGRLYSFVART